MPKFPSWLNKKISLRKMDEMKSLLSDFRLHTICEEAMCPNISECFSRHVATFLILGNICTRNCEFCSVKKGSPLPVDIGEPGRVAKAIAKLGLKFAVITSPTRDDLLDGGAEIFLKTIDEIKKIDVGIKVEILIPDFQGDISAIKKIANSAADIVGHNLETVKRLYAIRRGADYERSLFVLRKIKEFNPEKPTKSGIMVGLGEKKEEVRELFGDLIDVGCEFLSIGQYLRPTKKCRPVEEFVRPERFDEYKEMALAMGFRHVESGPYVRSSYHAENYVR